MKILYLQQLLVLPQTPGNPRCFEFAQHFAAAGHQVHFISSTAGIPEDHPFRKGEGLPDGISLDLIEVPYAHEMSFPKRLLSFIRFFRKAFKRGKQLQGFDLVLAYSAPLTVGQLGKRLARYHDLPFVFEIADVWPDVPIGMGIIPKGPWRNWLYHKTNQMYAAAQQIAVFSEGMQAQVAAHGIPDHKISVVHNGVDCEKIPFTQRQAKQGLEIIYTGTIGKANDLSQLLRLAQRLQARGQDQIQFTVIGSGNDAERIYALAEAWKLENISFHQRISKEAVTEKLAQADMGFSSFAPYPVLEANSATKFFDYLAAGLPLILNYEGWQAQYLAQHQSGIFAPQGDIESLCEQLIDLANNPAKRMEMSRKARALAEQAFHRPVLAKKMLGILETAQKKQRHLERQR